MAGPNDYTIQQPNIGGSILGGIQAGNEAIAGMAQADAARAAQERHQQFSVDLQNHLANPSFRSSSAMIAKYPEFQKALTASFETYDKGQKDETFKTGMQTISAIQNGKPEVARKLLEDRIAATENAGQDASDLHDLLKQFDNDPKAVETGLSLTMSALNPEAFSKVASERRASALAPAEQSLAESKAEKAAVDAKYADSKAVQELDKLGWETSKLKNDIGISRINSQIAAMNAETNRLDSGAKSEASREANRLKSDELKLKIQEKEATRDSAIRAKADEAQGGADTLNQISNQIGELFADEDSLRAATGTGALRGAIPGTSARTAAGKIQQLQDILASANLDKLKGPMSDKDIEFVRRLGSNLDRYQDEESFIKELNKLNELLPNAMDKLNSKYGSTFTLQKNEKGIQNDTGAPPPGAVRRIN